MKHSGALAAATVLVLAMLACQSAAGLPIPGGSASSGQVEAKGICAREPDLGFDVDLNLWYTEGSTPLELDLGIKGGSAFFVGVPIRSGTPDIDELVQLEFPLTEGATQEFDLEGLVDLEEWKVALHLTPGS